MSNFTPDLNPSQPDETQQPSTEAFQSNRPEEFRPAAHEVNSSAGEEDSRQTTETSTNLPAAAQAESQTELVEKVVAPFSEVLSTLAQVWRENRRLLVALGLVLALLPLVAVVASLLVVIHSIPFLAFFLKVIGLGYSLWFISQYFFLETKRQKLLGLWQKLFEAAKSQSEMK